MPARAKGPISGSDVRGLPIRCLPTFATKTAPLHSTSAVSSNQVQLPPSVANAFVVAIRIAGTFRGATAPNPPVGCVVLDAEGRSLAVAAHERAGQPHAETAGLAICRRQATIDRIRTVVVTLEPCNHWGRTPPCAEAILGTPARTVWFGSTDPNPRAGGGAARLRAAGLDVIELAACSDPTAAELAAECRSLVAPFAKRILSGKPWVTVKQALDRQGSMIPPPGRKTFTSPDSLTFAHALRKRADAILTGSGTILADQPEFTVRHLVDHPGKRRRLAVLDRRGRVSPSYIAGAAELGFDVSIEQDLETALDQLGREGMLEVLVEAGPRVTESVLDCDLWDEHVIIRKHAGGLADEAEIRRRAYGPVRHVEFPRRNQDGSGA